MKKHFLTCFMLIFVALTSFAQVQDPVKWQSKIEKISDTEYKISLDGTIEKGWHLYSQFTPDGGALPTEFNYNNAEGNYTFEPKATESEYKKVFNDVFEVDEYFFADEVHFTHNLKITNTDVKQVELHLFYQACTDVCISNDKYFVFDLEKLTSKEVVNFEAAKTQEKQNAEEAVKTAVPEKKTESRGLWTIFILSFLKR